MRDVPSLDPVDVLLAVTRGAKASTYLVKVTYHQPEREAEFAGVAQRAPVTISQKALRELWLEPREYGAALSKAVFAHPDLRADLSRIRALADSRGAPIRLRLNFDDTATELHAVRWETLLDPDDGHPLATSERVWMSRFLSTTQDVALPELHGRRLSTLLVVASPSDAEAKELAPVDAAAEVARMSQALRPIAKTTVLARLPVEARPKADGPPTLDAIAERLRSGVDLLVLVAHGRLVDGKPLLYLEEPDGTASKVTGADLIERIDGLPRPPRLVVLISCQSGAPARNRDGVLSALGPALAAAGVPAVVAMQGDVSVETATRFTTSFFEELAGHGQIDRAMAVARGEVRDAPDAWMPALFMRLRTGLLWEPQVLPIDFPPFDKWPVLEQGLSVGKLTPVLGPGLLQSLMGSTRDIAEAWAMEHEFPFDHGSRFDLPQVTQYVAVHYNDPEYPRVEMRRFIKQSLLDKYGEALGRADPERTPADLELPDLVAAVGAFRRANEPDEAHAILASMPFRQYLTTNPDPFMEDAVREATHQGRPREPHVELCRWNDAMEWRSELDDPASTYRPSVAAPLVYHLYGDFRTDRSIVLTEDDHFDFLIGLGRNAQAVPRTVVTAIKDDALLFLGFRLDSWNFRVLLRSFTGMADGGRTRPYFAVQVDPTTVDASDPVGALKYLLDYLDQADVSIYWGSVDEFLAEFRQRIA